MQRPFQTATANYSLATDSGLVSSLSGRSSEGYHYHRYWAVEIPGFVLVIGVGIWLLIATGSSTPPSSKKKKSLETKNR
ncbi:hypothetical protein CVT25_014509 [Psilocybe cyanescens]|uniref:Uncharacterized protein n=1 Tax=Psilocybe cyanescens TaxID=93625 RepID=A0A409VP90_PSICY|nr:hypothetical protein CVT25_014509 [Psilocybe cyanescens]